MFCAIEGDFELRGGWGVLAFVILFIVVAAIVFLVKFFAAKKNAEAEVEAPEGDALESAPDMSEPAPGRSGEVVLRNVTDREAVLLMAITAEKLQKPINTLQFVSITKISEEKK